MEIPSSGQFLIISSICELNFLSYEAHLQYFRRTEDDNDGFIHIIDPYFADDPSPSSRCGVRNGASLLLEAFCALKSELQMGNLRRLTQIRLP